MVIITGVRLAGKVDAIPHVGHVATRFFHLYYVPLIPLGTFLIPPGASDESDGTPLPLSWKSVIVGWLRSIAFVAFLPAALWIFNGTMRGEPRRVLAGVVTGVLAGIVLLVVYRLKAIRQASYERAVEIGRRIQLPPETMLMLDVAYGRLNMEQADRELDRLFPSDAAIR